LPKGRKFNQDYFISTVLPELVKGKRRRLRRKRGLPILIHMDNSACHNGHKITDKLTATDIARALQPPYSPDLNPCDFWFFGLLKDSMKGVELSAEDLIVEPITAIWRGNDNYLARWHFRHAALCVPRMDTVINLSH
jgi:transposase